MAGRLRRGAASPQLTRDQIFARVASLNEPQAEDEITVSEFAAAAHKSERWATDALRLAFQNSTEIQGLRVTGRRTLGRKQIYKVELWEDGSH